MGFASNSGDGTRNNSCVALQPETYPVQGWEDFSHSELSAAPLHTAFNISLPSPSRPCPLQAVPPALLHCAEELLVGRAVSLQRCPLARSSRWAQEPGPAQQRRELLTRGNSRELILNQAEAIPDVRSLSRGETLTFSSVIPLVRRSFIKESPCPLPLLGKTPRM